MQRISVIDTQDEMRQKKRAWCTGVQCCFRLCSAKSISKASDRAKPLWEKLDLRASAPPYSLHKNGCVQHHHPETVLLKHAAKATKDTFRESRRKHCRGEKKRVKKSTKSKHSKEVAKECMCLMGGETVTPRSVRGASRHVIQGLRAEKPTTCHQYTVTYNGSPKTPHTWGKQLASGGPTSAQFYWSLAKKAGARRLC